jgi:hypothetical protein
MDRTLKASARAGLAGLALVAGATLAPAQTPITVAVPNPSAITWAPM